MGDVTPNFSCILNRDRATVSSNWFSQTPPQLLELWLGLAVPEEKSPYQTSNGSIKLAHEKQQDCFKIAK